MKQILILCGHLGKDPELRHTKKGTPVANLSLACKSGWGERERTTWFRCSAFNKRAEALAEYASKGDLLLVRGFLEVENVKDKETGEQRPGFWLNVIVDEFTFLASKEKKHSSATPEMGTDTEFDNFDPEEEDDDIPF